MLINAMKRVLVYWKTDLIAKPTIARFSDSIVDILKSENCTENETVVFCSLINDSLILSNNGCDGEKYILRRPNFCPIKNMCNEKRLQLSPFTSNRGINVGVTVLLQSSDKCVLLTKRSRSMRTFPNVWVPPGGHIELKETLEEAGLRELKEETGVIVKGDQTNSRILGLWESTFPPSLSLGILPKRHHVVVYLVCKDARSSKEINSIINLQEDEVEKCAWVCSCLAAKIVASDTQFLNESVVERLCNVTECSLSCPMTKNSKIIGASVFKGKTEQKQNIDFTPMLNKYSIQNKDMERVSTGTKFALKLWLQCIHL